MKWSTDVFITARIRRMGEGNIFSLFTFGGGGIPISGLRVGGYPDQV